MDRRFFREMPTVAEIGAMADGCRDPDGFARRALEFWYQSARLMILSLLDPEEDDEDEHDTGDPVGLEMPALDAVDYGTLPNLGTDPTRHDWRR